MAFGDKTLYLLNWKILTPNIIQFELSLTFLILKCIAYVHIDELHMNSPIFMQFSYLNEYDVTRAIYQQYTKLMVEPYCQLNMVYE